MDYLKQVLKLSGTPKERSLDEILHNIESSIQKYKSGDNIIIAEVRYTIVIILWILGYTKEQAVKGAYEMMMPLFENNNVEFNLTSKLDSEENNAEYEKIKECAGNRISISPKRSIPEYIFTEEDRTRQCFTIGRYS